MSQSSTHKYVDQACRSFRVQQAEQVDDRTVRRPVNHAALPSAWRL